MAARARTTAPWSSMLHNAPRAPSAWQIASNREAQDEDDDDGGEADGDEPEPDEHDTEKDDENDGEGQGAIYVL